MEKPIFRWAIVDEHPNYDVSDAGEIRNRKTGRILGGYIDKDGYHNVHLYTEHTTCKGGA